MGQNLDLILLFITIELGLELFFLQVELKGRPFVWACPGPEDGLAMICL